MQQINDIIKHRRMVKIKKITGWYTFSHASLKIGKNRNYFINRYRLSPNIFPDDCILEVDNIKFINEKGISEIQKKIKKVVVHVNTTNIYDGLNSQMYLANSRPHYIFYQILYFFTVNICY